MKAKITQVQIGNISIEGLMLPDGTFAIALTQVSDLLELAKDHASRDVKALLGRDLELAKQATEITNNKIFVLTLTEFTDVIKNATKKGNTKALDLLMLLAGLSLQQLFSDAFGVKFDKEDRQSWLKKRQQGKYHRRGLTDAIDDYMSRHAVSDNYRKFIYSNCSNWLNKAVMKGNAKQLKEKLAIPKNSLLRDHIPEAAIVELGLIEEYAKRLIDEDEIEPYEAVKMACIVMKARTITID